MTNSRNKGAQFEREIAGELHDRLGITFKRDLEQYRASDHGDLIADCEFPYLIECKRRAGGGFQTAWWQQAYKAALSTGQFPAVIYRFNNQKTRVRVQLKAAMQCLSGKRWSAEDAHIIDIDLDGFAYLVREAMQ